MWVLPERDPGLDRLLRVGQRVLRGVELPVRPRHRRCDARELLLRPLLRGRPTRLSPHRLSLRNVQLTDSKAALPLRIPAYAIAVACVGLLAVTGLPYLALPGLSLVAGWSAAWSP
jgi:hypothetical protein